MSILSAELVASMIAFIERVAVQGSDVPSSSPFRLVSGSLVLKINFTKMTGYRARSEIKHNMNTRNSDAHWWPGFIGGTRITRRGRESSKLRSWLQLARGMLSTADTVPLETGRQQTRPWASRGTDCREGAQCMLFSLSMGYAACMQVCARSPVIHPCHHTMVVIVCHS